MKHQNVEFEGIRIKDPVEETGLTFEGCLFSACVLGIPCRSPQDRLVLKQMTLRDCTLDSLIIGPVVFEDCLLENLKTLDLQWVHGAAFKHCIVRGEAGEALLFEEKEPLEPRDSKSNAPFIAENQRIYESIDWALDISEAQFHELDIRGVPAERIRINDRNQIKVNYQRLREAYDAGQLEGAPFSEYIDTCLEDYEDSEMNFVLVSHPDSPEHDEEMELFQYLRKLGMTFR